MLPILAAINAIDTADKLATGAMALWKQMIASKAEAKIDAAGKSGSFTDALAAQGAASEPVRAGNAMRPVDVEVAGQDMAKRILNQLS